MQIRFLRYYKAFLYLPALQRAIPVKRKKESRPDASKGSREKVEMEGEQASYCGNRTEHLHQRTTLGYESAQETIKNLKGGRRKTDLQIEQEVVLLEIGVVLRQNRRCSESLMLISRLLLFHSFLPPPPLSQLLILAYFIYFNFIFCYFIHFIFMQYY